MTNDAKRDAFSELDHPCKETCSGWRQGFEKGQKACPRCSDLFYDPKMLVESEKQRAAEWEEIAKRNEEKLKKADEKFYAAGWNDCSWHSQELMKDLHAENDRLKELLRQWRASMHDFSPTAIMLDEILSAGEGEG